jgi:hypothetical protein
MNSIYYNVYLIKIFSYKVTFNFLLRKPAHNVPEYNQFGIFKTAGSDYGKEVNFSGYFFDCVSTYFK